MDKLELNKVYNIDCIEMLDNMIENDIKVDLIIADPPYGQNIRNEKGKIDFDTAWNNEDEYLNWCRIWLEKSKKVLNDNGILLVWGVAPIINEISHILNKELEMKFYTQIVWKVVDGLRPTHNYFYSNHQILLGYSKNNKDDFNSFKNHNSTYNHFTEEAKSYSGKKNMGTVWEHCKISKNHKEGTAHPTQKPEKLNERMVLGMSNENSNVAILFAGSGSEIISCIKNNRNYIASEINQDYIDEFILPRI